MFSQFFNFFNEKIRDNLLPHLFSINFINEEWNLNTARSVIYDDKWEIWHISCNSFGAFIYRDLNQYLFRTFILILLYLFMALRKFHPLTLSIYKKIWILQTGTKIIINEKKTAILTQLHDCLSIYSNSTHQKTKKFLLCHVELFGFFDLFENIENAL